MKGNVKQTMFLAAAAKVKVMRKLNFKQMAFLACAAVDDINNFPRR